MSKVCASRIVSPSQTVYLCSLSLTSCSFSSSVSLFIQSPIHTYPSTCPPFSKSLTFLAQGSGSGSLLTVSSCCRSTGGRIASSHMLRRTASCRIANTTATGWCPGSGSGILSYPPSALVTFCWRLMIRRWLSLSTVWRSLMRSWFSTSFRRRDSLMSSLSGIDRMLNLLRVFYFLRKWLNSL